MEQQCVDVFLFESESLWFRSMVIDKFEEKKFYLMARYNVRNDLIAWTYKNVIFAYDLN
jgi:hypothetical protein